MKPRITGLPLALLNTAIVLGALARGALELLVWSIGRKRK